MRLAVIMLLAAGPALAEPAYFRAPDWAVTVRATPGGEPIGVLPPGALIETTAAEAGFVRVPLAESDGWVAVDALRPAEVARLPGTTLPDGLLCTGTEPFWSLRLAASGARFETPGAEPQPFGIRGAEPAAGRTAPILVTMMQDGRSMLAVLRPEACSDGMSDRTQAWTADVVVQVPGAAGGVLALRSGCCRLP